MIKLKIGDKLYCHNNLFDNKLFEHSLYCDRKLTINRSYVIHSIENGFSHGIMILIINDLSSHDWYSLDNTDEWYYQKYFYTENDYRRLKLKRLKMFETRL